MKKNASVFPILIACLCLAGTWAQAQTITATTYAFARNGFAPDLTGPTTQLIGANADNVASAVTNIGFTFWFAGASYTQFSVSENGVMRLGNSRISGSHVNNNLTNGSNLPRIAPYWDDLATGTNGSVVYKVTGTAPNRELLVTWLVTVPKNAAAANSTIQVKLTETTGLITFTYGSPAVPANANQYSIGICASSTDFASVTPTSATAATCAYGTANDAVTISPGVYTRYNFTPDATPPTITHTALASVASTSNRTLTATIADAKTGIPIAGSLVPRIYYKKMFTGTYTSSPGTLTAGTSASGTWTFTIDHAAVGGVTARDSIYYYLIAQDQSTTVGQPNVASHPAGVSATDVNTIITPPVTLNNYKILGAPIFGTLTVGTSGANYTSLTKPGGLFEELNDGKLTGNVIVNIITDLTDEPGTTFLNAWVNDVGGQFSVTMNPVGARIVSGPGTLMKLNGTNGLTIDGVNSGGNSLSFVSSGGPAIHFAFGASNNSISRVTLSGAGTGVVAFNDASGSFPTNCSNNAISHCTISGGSVGVYFGSWVAASGMNNTLHNNVIRDFGQYGIHLDRGYLNFSISNNDIFQTAGGNYSTGIYIYNSVGTTNIFNNKIHDLKSGTGLGVWTSGIYYRFGASTDVLNIYNNVIALDAVTTNVAAYFLYGLQMAGAGTSNIYYNSIYIGGTGVTSGNSAGMYKTAGTVNFKNNAVFNARSGSAPSDFYKNYGVCTINLTGFVSDHNLLFANGTNGILGNVGANIGQSSGTHYPTLVAWQTATGQDALSYSGDPGFTSATDLTPDPANPHSHILNNVGVPIATIAADILGNTRSTSAGTGPTDIGAYEFTPLPINAVTISGNAGIAGAVLHWTELAPQTATADETGAYTATVESGWSGTITPMLAGYTFTPANRIYTDVRADLSDQNYTAAAVTFTITGNAGAPGATLSWTDITAKTATADGSGAYTITVSYNWSGTVTPTLAGNIFVPVQRTYTDVLSDLTGQDYTPKIFANITVILEGPFAEGVMTTDLNKDGILPLSSETAYPASSFGYTARSVTSIPNPSIVDWVLVELRSGTSAGTKVLTLAGFLTSSGAIVDLDGTSALAVGLSAGNYYVVVRHRNHLPIMSAAPVALSDAGTLYDFTGAQSQAYGTTPMKNLGVGLFALYAGNNDADLLISTNDYNAVGLTLFASGYRIGDHNMNGNIFVDDYNFVGSNLFMVSQVP